MKPKEKAKQLFDKIKEQNYDFYSFDGSERDENAKQIALICVDKIIEALNDNIDYSKVLSVEWTYWQEVKQEIEKAN